jgi:transposase
MYSKDIRSLAKILYLKIRNFRTVANFIHISKSTIHRWVSNTKFYKIIKHKHRIRKITSNVITYILELIKNNSFIYLREIQLKIEQKFNIHISISRISIILKKNKITKKKVYKTYFGKSIEDIKDKELTFKDNLKNIDINNIISIDETYFHITDIPRYGWSEKGNRITKQQNYKRNKQSLLLAVSNKKIVGYLFTPKSINTKIYNEFIESLNMINKIIVHDNVAFHKNKLLIDILNKNNNNQIFIPPYSPQYNPIEMVFSELKRISRKRISNREKIDESIISSLNISNLQNYFNHSFNFSI